MKEAKDHVSRKVTGCIMIMHGHGSKGKETQHNKQKNMSAECNVRTLVLYCEDVGEVGIGYFYLPSIVTNIAFISITCTVTNARACQPKLYDDNDDDELRSKRTSTKIKTWSGCKVDTMFVHVLYPVK